MTESFFLSPRGKQDPEAELEATITAFYFAEQNRESKDARCRFPARYFWLSKYLPVPQRNLREEACLGEEKWAMFDSVKSISLLLVSGYWGNPASTFGHAFMRLNTNLPDDPHDLFDLTLNYGAITPERENPIRYVIKGLFGGYEGGFSDKYFYTQDMSYVRTEFRDIWDFELNLTEDERTMLIFHIWEVVDSKFKYFFLDKNCAFKLAELADLVIGENVIDHHLAWYVPEELFFRLKDIDRERRLFNKPALLRSVRFIPSSRRVLFHRIGRLKPEELVVFNNIVRDGIDSMSRHLQGREVDFRINVLNTLLAYQQYRAVAEGKANDQSMRRLKDQILLARLQLPVQKTAPLNIPTLPSPAEGSRPRTFGLGVGMTGDGDAFTRMSFSPFRKETVGQNSLEGDELVVLDTAVGFFEDNMRAFVDKFDLLRMVDLNTSTVTVANESQRSWQMRIGVDRVEQDGQCRHDGVVSYGIGKAWQPGQALIGYGMVDVSAHSQAPGLRVRPHLGLRTDAGRWRTWLLAGVESEGYEGRFAEVWGGKTQYQLNERQALHLEVSNERAGRITAGLIWYW